MSVVGFVFQRLELVHRLAGFGRDLFVLWQFGLAADARIRRIFGRRRPRQDNDVSPLAGALLRPMRVSHFVTRV